MTTEPRVLIVQADDVLRTLLFTVLRMQPISVDTASSAEEALRRVTECDYALILLDLDLPDDEAKKFVSDFVEERPESTSFIIAVKDTRTEFANDRIGAVLSKPLELDTLAAAVRECALVIPPPDDPLPCPPADSDPRHHIRTAPFVTQ